MLFDAPHMMKCVRNNWLNVKSLGRSFEYPEFVPGFGKIATYENLEDLYHLEKEKLLKPVYFIFFCEDFSFCKQT